MKLLSRLAGLVAALLFSAVALAGTASAKLPPEDPDGPVRVVPASNDAPPATVDAIVGSGLSTLQVVALMLCAAIAAAVVSAIVTRRMPRIHTSAAYAKGRVA